MRTRLLAMVVASAWCGLSSPLARAQTAYEANFETTFPTFGYGYGYSGYGELDYSAVDTSSQTPSAFNVSTPPAATASLDTTQWTLPGYETYTYCGWGLGMGFAFPETMRPTSGDLTQYTVSFDANVAGYDPLDDGIRTDVLIIFQGPGYDAEEYKIGVNGDNLGQFIEVPLLTSTTQTITRPLSDFAVIDSSEWDFLTLFAQTTQVLVQLQPSTNLAEIGLDNDNVLTVDNVRIEGPFAGALPGNFDGDDDVDGNDLLVWQRGESPEGLVQGDLMDWRTNYGAPMAAAALSAVPEPGCLALASAAALGLLSTGRRQTKQKATPRNGLDASKATS